MSEQSTAMTPEFEDALRALVGIHAEGEVALYRNYLKATLDEMGRLRAQLDLYVGHEQRLRQRIAQDVNRADAPKFPAEETPEEVARTVRAIDIRLILMGSEAPYWVPEGGAK